MYKSIWTCLQLLTGTRNTDVAGHRAFQSSTWTFQWSLPKGKRKSMRAHCFFFSTFFSPKPTNFLSNWFLSFTYLFLCASLPVFWYLPSWFYPSNASAFFLSLVRRYQIHSVRTKWNGYDWRSLIFFHRPFWRLRHLLFMSLCMANSLE